MLNRTTNINYIGRSNVSSDGYFSGSIAGLYLFNSVLSDSNISSITTSNFPLKVESLYWNNNLLYSSTGTQWTSSSSSLYFIGNKVRSNNTGKIVATGQCFTNSTEVFISVGNGNNSIAYSYDGTNFTGLGTSIFTTGYGVAYNFDKLNWVSVGFGANTIAYSNNGVQWTGLGTTVFSNTCYCVTYSNSIWVAGGYGVINSLAYSVSSTGSQWVGLGSSIFSACLGISYGGNKWVSLGSGNNTLAYSNNGTIWIGLGSTIFITKGNSVAYNGNIWVAGGQGSNTLAYSTNGIDWIGLGTRIFTQYVNGVTYANGIFVACGYGSSITLAYSNLEYY